ncbi:MAG: hypothetical protein EOP24_36170 [Hyphomicrobiales bacterium]|nr:MAG: hypothetical protein EOP24_36170 [Hyphomicrobiales bacterium]
MITDDQGSRASLPGSGAANPEAFLDDKSIATLKAQFALIGHELIVVRMADGRRYFEVRRWGQARMFSSIHGVEGFRRQIGGAA